MKLVSTESFEMWLKTGRDIVLKVIKECKTDHILIFQLETLVNHVDSNVANRIQFGDAIDEILRVLNQDSYYERFRDNDEEKKIRELASQFNQISKFAKYDLSANNMYAESNPDVKKVPVRLPQGEIKTYEPNKSRQRLSN